jgi:plasmid maintenance system antidote protein VapI
MEHRRVKRSDLIEAIGVDKGMISRWLDEEKPTTPGPDWAAKLNAYFGGEGDPVDIFQHPDDDWFSRMVRSNSHEKVRQAIQILEAAGITPQPPKKASNRS